MHASLAHSVELWRTSVPCPGGDVTVNYYFDQRCRSRMLAPVCRPCTRAAAVLFESTGTVAMNHKARVLVIDVRYSTHGCLACVFGCVGERFLRDISRFRVRA